MNVKTGSYTGDGNAGGKAITGVGFQPRFVLVRRDNATNASTCRIETMPADNGKPITGANALTTTAVIKSLDADGFTVSDGGAAVNQNAAVYQYLAIGGEGTDFAYGTYAGDSADGREITAPAFQPDLVLVISEAANRGAWRSSDFSGDNAANFSQVQAANKIQSFIATGFSLGTDASTNATGTNYHWIAVKNTTSFFKVLTYTGNAGDNRDITGAGFQPTFALTQRIDSSTVAIIRSAAVHSGDESVPIDGSVADAANKIQAFGSDGFQVGTDGTVNADTATYAAFVFKDGIGAVASVVAGSSRFLYGG